jgi:hypothetical protein
MLNLGLLMTRLKSPESAEEVDVVEVVSEEVNLDDNQPEQTTP